MAGKIFINYRRGDDPGNTGRLFDRLQDTFQPDQLFMDIDNIAPGLDFLRVIEEQVEQCDALLAVIGPRWLDATDERGNRRLDDPNDFVRVEIEAALRQDKRVIPVLVGDARLPRAEELPDPMRSLARRNAVRLTHERFRADAQGLVTALQRALEDVEAVRQARTEAARRAQAVEERRREEAAANARAEALREAEERARRDKEQARLTAIAGLSPDHIAKAEELANWEFIKGSAYVRDFRDHLARFPGGVTDRFARTRLEDLVWADLGDAPTLEQLSDFLVEFPKGTRAQQAGQLSAALERERAEAEASRERTRRETEAWMAASKQGDVAPLTVFLKEWPGGQYAKMARAQLRRLTHGPVRRRLMRVFLASAAAIIGLVIVGTGVSVLFQERQRAEQAAKVEDERRRAERAAKVEQERERAEALAKAEAEAEAKRLEAEPALAVIPGSGKSFRDRLADGQSCPFCPEMVVVPSGSFTMGSPPNEAQRTDGEKQVRITVAQPFAVGIFAVSFDQWDACVAEGSCNGYKPNDQGWGRGNRPVINVNWNDAKAFAEWLSRKTGKTYRLLSEAEREYVTRAGTTTPFWSGSKITTNQANYDNSFAKGEYRQQTVPVDSFEANPWGLFNVHGNVWEWTEGCWAESNQSNPENGSARTTGDCGRRVLRGGSWFNDPSILRAAKRAEASTNYRSNNLGFRLARDFEMPRKP